MMLSVILIYIIMMLLFSMCDLVSDLWQQLELTSELECDLKDTVQLFSFDQSRDTGAIDVKMYVCS